MTIGTVLGPVALQRAVPGGAERRFVRVQCGAQLVTALDSLDTQPGEQVLLAAGEGAGRLCPEIPVDAVILGIVGNNG